TNHTLIYPNTKDLNLNANEKDVLSFWIKYEAENGGNQRNHKPIVRLYQDEQNYYEYTPTQAFLDQLYAPISEQRSGWKHLEIPLTEGNSTWIVKKTGEPSLQSVQYLNINEGPSTSGISTLWIDG